MATSTTSTEYYTTPIPSSDTLSTTVTSPDVVVTTSDDIITNPIATETNVSLVDVTTPIRLLEFTTGDIDVTETPKVSNVTNDNITTRQSTTEATEPGKDSGFSVTGLAITALLILLL